MVEFTVVIAFAGRLLGHFVVSMKLIRYLLGRAIDIESVRFQFMLTDDSDSCANKTDVGLFTSPG